MAHFRVVEIQPTSLSAGIALAESPTVTVTAAQDAAAETAAGDSPTANPFEQYPHGRGELILVVDDEPAVRFISEQILSRFGYRVLTAENGQEGLAVYAKRREEIALVISDMMMPVMDGPTMVGTLVQMDPQARIMVASGSLMAMDRHLFTRHGVTHFLPKPYTALALLEAVRELLPVPAQ